MNKTSAIIFGALAGGILLLIVINQLRLNYLIENKTSSTGAPVVDAETIRKTTAALDRAQRDAAQISQRLAEATRQLQAVEAQLQQLQSRVATMRSPGSGMIVPDVEVLTPPPIATRGRGWGPEQVVGPPDTMQAGDQSTAWAARMPDNGAEWLKVDYERETQVAEVRVRESYNPGAIIKVTAVLAGGEEALLWEGEEPSAEAPIDRSFPVANVNVPTKSIKIYLDTKKVPGWNEIDAVELIGKDGSRQWASQASASSSYADPR